MSTIRVTVEPVGNLANTYDASNNPWLLPAIDITDNIVASNISIQENVSTTDFRGGVLTQSVLKFTLIDQDKKLANLDSSETIFPYGRDRSIIKIYWSYGNFKTPYGTNCWDFMNCETEVYTGMFDDRLTRFSADTNTLEISIVSLLNELKKVTESMAGSYTYGFPSAHTVIEQAVWPNIGNFSPINSFLISGEYLGLTAVFYFSRDIYNNYTSFSNVSLWSVIENFCKINLAYVSLSDDRSELRFREIPYSGLASARAVSYTFYGPGIDGKIENIISITNFSDGIERIINSYEVNWSYGQYPSTSLWVASTIYAAGVMVYDYLTTKKTYSSTKAHTASTSFGKDLQEGLWKLGPPEWKESTGYSIGNCVKYDGIELVCNTAHTSTTSFATNSSKWTSINPITYTDGASQLTYGKRQESFIDENFVLQEITPYSHAPSDGTYFHLVTIATAFKDPKRRLQLSTPLTEEVLALRLFDSVNIIIEPVLSPEFGGNIPRFDFTSFDNGITFPQELNNMTFDATITWIIEGRDIKLTDNIIVFHLREY